MLDLQPNGQDTTAAYLQMIYEFQVNTYFNESVPPAPLSPPDFSAPSHIVWANSLWFLGLCISLTCPFMAMQQHQWASQYLKLRTQGPRTIPYDRARIHEFFAGGADEFLSWRTLRLLIQISVFLFFAGLLIYLFNIHHTVFRVVACWVEFFVLSFIFITVLPLPIFPLKKLFRSPYFLVIGLFQGMETLGKEAAKKWPKDIDGRILSRFLDVLTEDSDLMQFFEIIPGFCTSSVVDDPPNRFTSCGRKKLAALGCERSLETHLVIQISLR
jgi:hypothetical protein